MKCISRVIQSIFLITTLSTLNAEKELPVLELAIQNYSQEQALPIINSVLRLGYNRFDFCSIGSHIQTFFDQMTHLGINHNDPKKFIILCAHYKDLQTMTSFKKIGILFAENGIGQNNVKPLIDHEIIVDYGALQSEINPLFFEDKQELFFKFVPGNSIDMKELISNIIILKKSNADKKIVPLVSLPIDDACYTNRPPLFTTIADTHSCKLYQVIFALLEKMGIHVIPKITEALTKESSAELVQSFYLDFLPTELQSIQNFLSQYQIKSRL